jgi:hypothetical protein
VSSNDHVRIRSALAQQMQALEAAMVTMGRGQGLWVKMGWWSSEHRGDLWKMYEHAKIMGMLWGNQAWFFGSVYNGLCFEHGGFNTSIYGNLGHMMIDYEPFPSPKNNQHIIGFKWVTAVFPHMLYPLVICYIAIENDHRNSGFSHWKWWFSIVM